MKKIKVEIRYTGRNFTANIPKLTGCVATGKTPDLIRKNIKVAIDFHLEGSIKDGDQLPKEFLTANYQLVYLFDTESLLNYYKGIFTKSALMRLTGINQQQLHHYSNGLKKPRLASIKKIEFALHQLGAELLSVQL